jgi:hypothetical protein
MSANPDVETIVALPIAEAIPPAQEAPAPEPTAVAVPARKRPAWIVPVAIAAVGAVASGTLGYFLYVTVQQRDGLHQRLVSTSASLATTHDQLNAAQADAASKKVTATYVAMYVADNGKVDTEYQTLVSCSDYSACRTAAQQMLANLQAFQADRKAAEVPSTLTSTDSSLGDALSAAIAGDQEMITGIDNGDVAKAKEGGGKVDAAMLSLAKVQSSLGASLK